MQLLTFAHRPEAHAFFEAYSFKSTFTQGLYQFESGWLLITGEGIHESMVSVAWVLGQHSEISEVLNFGVAGSLSSKALLHQVYEIRTSYAFDESPLFKSFSHQGEVDCVTSGKRVLSENSKAPLLAMGDVVDRELWGISFAAKNRNVKVRSFKFISDQAGELTACEVVKDLAQQASQALLEAYIKVTPAHGLSSIHLPGFYFTFSQEHLFKNLLHKLSIKWELPEEAVLSKLDMKTDDHEKMNPKERTKRLLDKLKQSLDPWGSEFEKKNLESFQKLCPTNISSPNHFQSAHLKLSLSFQNREELEESLKALNSFDWDSFYAQYRVNDV